MCGRCTLKCGTVQGGEENVVRPSSEIQFRPTDFVRRPRTEFGRNYLHPDDGRTESDLPSQISIPSRTE